MASSFLVPGVISSSEMVLGGRIGKQGECRVSRNGRKALKGLMLVVASGGAAAGGGGPDGGQAASAGRGGRGTEDGKVLASSSRWLYMGNNLISQTVLQPFAITKAEGLWRRGLLELIRDILSGVDVQAVLEPWIDDLSVEECNKIMVEVGYRDWSLAMDVFRFLKERSPYIQKASLAEGSGTPHGDGKSSLTASKDGVEGGFKANALLKAYTTLVGVLSRKGRLTELSVLLHEIEQDEVEPDLRFYNGVAEAYSNLGMVPNVSEVLSQMARSGLQPDHATYELMIAACLRAKVPQLDTALQVFRTMLRSKLEVGVKTYLKLIDACVDEQNLKAGEEVFTAMRSTGHQVYSKTWVKMIQLHASAGGSKKAEELFRAMRASGVLPTASIYDALLVAYCRAGCLAQALSVFREYKLASKPSLVAYNCLIDASGKYGRYEESLALYSELSGNGLRPTTVTYTSLIGAMVQAGQHEKADRLYKKMLQKNLVPSGHTVTVMLQAYTSCGWTRLGHEICSKLKDYRIELNSGLYGAMLKLYVQGRWYREAANTMREMESRGLEPDASGYGVLIAALGELGDEITPLAKAMQVSDWEPCRIAFFLVSVRSSEDETSGVARDTTLEKAWSFLENWARCKDKDTNRSFYNALMDALWRRGLRRRAQLVMLKARALLHWYNRPRFGASSVLDLRGQSVGGALVALLDWLQEAATNSVVREAGHSMVIYTGGIDIGNSRSVAIKRRGTGAVKQAVAAYLEELCSPFQEGPEFGAGRLHADSELVMQWLSNHDSKDPLRLRDYA
ncbi:unnamed protein product [Calypogeia fissa]